MRRMLGDVWRWNRRGFLRILALNIAVSLTGGVSIVMLVPMLGLLDVSDGAASALDTLLAPLRRLPYGGQVGALVGAYFVLIALRALLARTLSLAESGFLEGYSFALRDRLYRKVAAARWECLTASRQTDTIDLFTMQCGQVSNGMAQIVHLITSLASSAVQLGIALWLSAPVTAFVIACGGAYAALFRGLLKRSKAYGEEMIALNRAMYSELFSQLRGIKEVRTYGVRREHAALFAEISESLRAARLKYVRMQSFPALLHSVGAAGVIAVIFLVSVLGFRMDTARLMVLVYVFTRLWPVFSGLMGRLQGIQTAIPAFDKLDAALNGLEEEPVREDVAPMAFEREIAFCGVRFAYRDSAEETLRGVDFVLPKGSVTALVGRSGAGKTTIADLLLGFLRPTGGEICIDGVALSEENLPAWRQGMGYIPQSPLILNASVRENLKRFHPDATEEEMVAALKKAQAWSFISDLRDGLDTMLGDEGVRLSGGERQRIVLARVLMGHPRLIVMDEATSAMDYESESAARDAVLSLEDGITVLIIAHRLATVRAAQRAIVLEDGVINESGALADLLARPDGYLGKLLYME